MLGLAVLPLLVAGMVFQAVLPPTTAGVPSTGSELQAGEGQLAAFWHETVKQLTVVVALPQYQFLEEEEQASEDTPLVSTSGLLQLLEMVL
ncbi:hypothetical protein GCM10007389_37480 [Pontibacter akesuensis]|nr:hypothetical protein GCM10007389_37480 [Pontibacter akesuensis]